MKYITAVFLTLMLISCDETGLSLLNIDNTGEVYIETLTEGTITRKGDPIPLRVIHNERQSITELEVILRDENDNVLSQYSYPQAQMEDPKLESYIVPDLDALLGTDSRFFLELNLFDQEGIVLSESKILFYVMEPVDVPPVEVYPNILSPGSTSLVLAVLNDKMEDYYLRWRQGDLILKEGFAWEDMEILRWTAPENYQDWAYPLTLELFPKGAEDIRGISSLAVPLEIIVRPTVPLGVTELGPESSYLGLMHLRGNLNLVGEMEETPLTSQGLEYPSLVQGEFGYIFDQDNYLELSKMVLAYDQGTLLPQTINFRGLLLEEEQGGALYTLFDEWGAPLLTISYDPSWGFYLTYEGQVISYSGWIPGTEVFNLSLSLIPDGDSLGLIWYGNGNSLLVERIEEVDLEIPEEGSTRIGGGNSPFLLDEWGVYYKDEADRFSTDGGTFGRSRVEQLGGQLIFAEGFDGLFLSPQLDLEGEGEIEMGVLQLEPDSIIKTPSFEIQGAGVQGDIRFDASQLGSGEVRLVWENINAAPVQIFRDRYVIEGFETPVTEPLEDVTFLIKLDKQGLFFGLEDQEMIPLPIGSGENINAHIEIQTHDNPLFLEDMTLFYTEVEIESLSISAE